MNQPEPFAYPPGSHVPAHAPAGYDTYQSYKPWLRDDFVFRCAYCLSRERWHPSGQDAFGVDHLEAKSTAPDLAVSYGNFVYACNMCNTYKGVLPLPVNPLYEGLAGHLAIDDHGAIQALTTDGQDLIDLLDLAGPGRFAVRADKLAVLRLKREHPDNQDVDIVFLQAFSYPNDLPDLRPLRPKSNALPEGVRNSHLLRHERGELPRVY